MRTRISAPNALLFTRINSMISAFQRLIGMTSENDSSRVRFSGRPGKESDIAAIRDLVVAGAKENHFSQRYAQNSSGKLLEKAISQAVTEGLWPTHITDSGFENATVGAAVKVFEIDGEFAGFLIYGEEEAESSTDTPPRYEIMMMSIVPEHRGQGYGSLVLDDFLGAAPSAWKLSARCLIASEQMGEMLQNRGFEEIDRGRIGVRHFVKSPEG